MHASTLINGQRSGEEQSSRESRHGWGQPTTSPPTTERLHLARFSKRVECPLDGALACTKRQRKGRARPGFTLSKEGEHRRILLFDGPPPRHHPACAARRTRQPPLPRAHARQRPKHPPKPPH